MIRKVKDIEPVYRLMKVITEAGHQAFLVGGCVRDMAMGLEPADFDVAVSALPEQVVALFSRVVPTGIKHGTVTVMDFGIPTEVTTFRTEGKYSDFRHPESVSFVANIEDDLSRRDFTINAMALDAEDGLVDPFGGLLDIEKRRLRAVGDADTRFREDALRMLRAVRFSARGFDIEENTAAAIVKNAALCAHISAERVAGEIRRILISNSPGTIAMAVGFRLLDKFLDSGRAAGVDFSPLENVEDGFPLRFAGFAGLLKGCGAVGSAEAFCRELKLCGDDIAAGRALDESFCKTPPADIPAAKRLLSRYGVYRTRALCAAYDVVCGGDALRLVDAAAASGECYSEDMLDISGHDIADFGYSGKEIGAVKRELLEHVIRFPADNTRAVLFALLSSENTH